MRILLLCFVLRTFTSDNKTKLNADDKKLQTPSTGTALPMITLPISNLTKKLTSPCTKAPIKKETPNFQERNIRVHLPTKSTSSKDNISDSQAHAFADSASSSQQELLPENSPFDDPDFSDIDAFSRFGLEKYYSPENGFKDPEKSSWKSARLTFDSLDRNTFEEIPRNQDSPDSTMRLTFDNQGRSTTFEDFEDAVGKFSSEDFFENHQISTDVNTQVGSIVSGSLKSDKLASLERKSTVQSLGILGKDSWRSARLTFDSQERDTFAESSWNFENQDRSITLENIEDAPWNLESPDKISLKSTMLDSSSQGKTSFEDVPWILSLKETFENHQGDTDIDAPMESTASSSKSQMTSKHLSSSPEDSKEKHILPRFLPPLENANTRPMVSDEENEEMNAQAMLQPKSPTRLQRPQSAPRRNFRHFSKK